MTTRKRPCASAWTSTRARPARWSTTTPTGLPPAMPMRRSTARSRAPAASTKSPRAPCRPWPDTAFRDTRKGRSPSGLFHSESSIPNLPQERSMDIAGKVFIVTGGPSGLGEGTARMLAEHGGKVVVADLQLDRGESVAQSIGGVFVKCDVSLEADGQAAVKAATGLGKLM